MFIKDGAQYRVYPIPGGRVRKVPHTLADAVKVWRRWGKGSALTSAEIREKALDSIDKREGATAVLERFCVSSIELHEYFGKPKFYKNGAYTQDRVQTLGAVLSRQSHEANIQLLEKYAEACVNEWRFGFSEVVFNFTVNSGLNSQDKIVLFDFGEVVFDIGEVKKAIKNRQWLQSWSYMHDLPPDLRQQYARIMERTLTVSNLERNWSAKHKQD